MNDLHKKYIEGKLHRHSGMAPDKRDRLNEEASKQPVYVYCWKCRARNDGLLSELKRCKACDVNLWSRQ